MPRRFFSDRQRIRMDYDRKQAQRTHDAVREAREKRQEREVMIRLSEGRNRVGGWSA